MVLPFAFSLQDQVETYGAYVGLAAFLGLAVLSLLYFAQARELKRLRDWAGRAPERAQELEARVVAQAEEARREPEPEPERSGTVGPAQPVAGNGRPAVPVPMGPRPAVAMARAAALAAGGAAAAGTAVAEPAEEAEEEAPATAEPAAEAAPATPDAPAEGAPPEDAAPAEPEEPGQDTEDAPAVAGNGAPGQPPQPVPIPRATPRPQPRPAAALRSSASRSTTLPPRRPAPPPRRPSEDRARAGRWTLFTLLAVAVLAVAIAVPVLLLSGDDTTPTPNTTAEPTADAPPTTGERPAVAREDTVVAVLNGTPIEGLASQTRDKLIAEGYAEEQGMIRTGNNTDQQRQDSVVLFAEGKRREGRDVGTILGITALEAVDPETQALADSTDETNSGRQADVVVILGGDQSP